MTPETLETRVLLMGSTNEELAPLVQYIMKATISEGLSNTESYKTHKPNHGMYSSKILHEIRLMGGHSCRNMFCGEGPCYLEVARDVARKVGVKKLKQFSLIELEEQIIETMLRKMLKDAPDIDKAKVEEMLRETGMKQSDLRKFVSGFAMSALLGAQIYRYVMIESSKMISYGIARNVIGQTLKMGMTGFAGGRAASAMMGPAGWLIGGLWTAFDLAGPAYRVTVPCVLHIAMLRQRKLAESKAEAIREAFND